MKIKNLIMLLIGILLGSVTVYAISVSSGNVTFTPEDTEWDVQDVEGALNDLNSSINEIKGEAVEILPIYDKGTYYYNFTKYDSSTSSGIVRDDDTSFFISTLSGASKCTSYFAKVDLTDIDAVYAHTVSTNDGYGMGLCVSEYPSGFKNATENINSLTCVKGATLKSANGTVTNNFYTDLANVSTLTGEYYIGVGVCGVYSGSPVSNGSVDGIYMVKKIFQN